jgi:hypothetical protein
MIVGIVARKVIFHEIAQQRRVVGLVEEDMVVVDMEEVVAHSGVDMEDADQAGALKIKEEKNLALLGTRSHQEKANPTRS